MRDERLFPLFESLDSLSGVGPKLKPVLERLVGGDSVWDLLLHLPERWVDRRVKASIDDAILGEVATLRGEVHAYHAPYSEKSPHKIVLYDGTGFLTLAFFRADGRWLQGQFPLGKERVVSGMVEEFNGERQMTHPDYIVDPARGALPPVVEPIYGLPAGLTNKRVHGFAVQALDRVDDDLPEWVDPALVDTRNWPDFKAALTGLHAPVEYDPEAFERARDRLAYDEALARESAFALARASRARRSSPSVPVHADAHAALLKSLPYTPTGAQSRAFRQISEDMASTSPMRRMLQGDVGAGKTLVSAMAAVQAASAGFQTAFMSPTEVLARQQFETMDTLLSPLGYTVAALTGPQDEVARFREAFERRRDLVVEGINSIDGLELDAPQGAFYAYIDCAGIMGKPTPYGVVLEDDAQVTQYLLDEARVAAVPGSAYGLSPFFRLSTATSDDVLSAAINRIADAVAKLA
jgi:ATP-dependent DNA helicase RecG